MAEVTDIQSRPAEASATASIVSANETMVADKRGRKIKLRRLGPLQRTRLFKIIGAENSNNAPLVGHYSMVVSVIGLDDEPIAFPTKEVQIEALLDRLGDDGLEAIAHGWKDSGWIQTDEGDPAVIKN